MASENVSIQAMEVTMRVRCLFTPILIIACIPFVLPGAEDPVLDTGEFTPSKTCGECHAQIYGYWSRSLHSGSLTDPIFDAAYARAYKETAGKAAGFCLRCHAPVAHLSGDLETSNAVSREGVTCDFCHSIKDVDLSNRNSPYRISFDGVKRGPLRDASSPVHEVEQSDLHSQSEFCAGCHEYANEDGLLIFSTYSEWKVSPQAKEGKACQACHMPITPGRTVVPELGVSRAEINLHNISGGHSREQVRKAARLRILGVRRTKPDVAAVEVEVTNVGSGHYLPTGMPTRKLLLEVDLYADRSKVKTFKRIYQRVLLDKKGQKITEDHEVMLYAKKLLSDNRLRPGEPRVEKFVVSVPTAGRLRAEARLRYEYEPVLFSREKMSILMVSDKTP